MFTETWPPETSCWLNLAKFAKYQILGCLETCTWTRPTPRSGRASCPSSGWPPRVSRTRSTRPSRMSGVLVSCSGNWTRWAPCRTRGSGKLLNPAGLLGKMDTINFNFRPESLLNLFQTGYRMEKPKGCPDSM